MLFPQTRRLIFFLNVCNEAYYQQATIGPNNEPRPSCFVSFFSGGDVDKKWTCWKNLGNLSGEDARTKFLGEIMHVKPDFMNADVMTGSKRASLRAIMQHDAAEIIQTAVRGMLARNKFAHLLTTSRIEDVEKLIDLLVIGIVVKILRSDGGAMTKKILSLVMGTSIYDSKLSISGKSKETEMSAYLVDIAEIRLGAKTYRFTPIQARMNENECFSIIFSERTFDIQVIQGETTRNWLAGCFLLLMDKVLSQKESARRGRVKGHRLLSVAKPHRNNELEARKLGNLMARSFGVEEYRDGVLTLQVIWTCWQQRRIFIGNNDAFNSEVGYSNDVEVLSSESAARGIDFDDIAEVRAGLITCEIDKDVTNAEKMITIVGSETSIILQFQSESIRDKFLSRLQSFVTQFKKPVRSFRGILPPATTRTQIESKLTSRSTSSSISSESEQESEDVSQQIV